MARAGQFVSSISRRISDFYTLRRLCPHLAGHFLPTTGLQARTVQQFNVNVEHQLPGNIVLTAGYAGSRGNHILVSGNNLEHQWPSGCGTGGSYTLGCAPAALLSSRPTLRLTSTPFWSSATWAKPLITPCKLRPKPRARRYGVYALDRLYLFPHTYDNGFADGLGSLLSAPYFPLPNWQTLDWAPLQIDLNNNFTASVIYDLPFGKGKKFGSDWNNVTNSHAGRLASQRSSKKSPPASRFHLIDSATIAPALASSTTAAMATTSTAPTRFPAAIQIMSNQTPTVD